MEMIKGTESKQDALVRVEDCLSPLTIEIKSPLEDLYGKSILKAASGELEALNVTTGKVIVEDRQALDFVIRARIKAAVMALREAGGEI